MNPHPSYELFEQLGQGQNTVVYRSYDLSLGREVAVKVLNEAARRDPRHRERFLREAQFLAQFEHDNVLRVYSVDTERGWIIMELMKGTLATVIADGPSSPDLVRSVLKQTLGALAFLHEKNKVHGTVRPTNLLINDHGRVKLSEFEQTALGAELRAPTGSKKYLAPELIRTEFGEFGPPLDLYCLGFTALELLKGPALDEIFPGTGKGAIDADIAWLRWHSSPTELAPMSKLVKGLPGDLAHVLDRLLKKRVSDRPQSAGEVLEELEDHPIVAVPVPELPDAEPLAPAGEAPAPAVVRTLAPGQQFSMPSGASSSSTSAPVSPSKKKPPQARRTKKAPPRLSKDWFNAQLGRPYVLYPLCAAILLGALWASFRLNSDPAAELIAVTFDVLPEADGVTLSEADKQLAANDTGHYLLPSGKHSLTLRKEGFHPVTRDFDVSPASATFRVELQPIVKYVDVAAQVTPADAVVEINGARQTLSGGAVNYRLEEGKPLEIDARLERFVAATRTFSPEELAKLDYKVSITLEREMPRLPDGLAPKRGAALNQDTLLPTRVVAEKLGEAMELVLVRPGDYRFGNPGANRLDSELPAETVRIEKPFYIATRETTNAQYNKFFETAGKDAAGVRWQQASRKWAEAQQLDPFNNNLPVTNVSPAQAERFCQWLGGRLPTEAEWESAARGLRDDGFPYPWTDGAPTPENCQIFHGTLAPVPVEQMASGSNSLGLVHLLGNAAEWCRDSQRPGDHVLRGCSFATANIDHVRITWRAPGNARGEEDTGFRVVVPIDDWHAPPRTANEPTRTHASTARAGGSGLLLPIQAMRLVPWKNLAEALGGTR